ncbi:helix-turn-helix domain-containing protein [Aquimarina sp. 2304DJ70-9]|uniref:helix-turn-helix domain-containing protein n=1 Tax=Aquimarina penaris TaxID=3231044 RepID=UPI003462ED33
MKKIKHKIVFLAIFIFLQNIYGQGITEENINLVQKQYPELLENFQQFIGDSVKAQKYAKAFLLKAKQDNNIIKKANGYYMLASISEHDTALLYADSIIAITKNVSDFDYPAKAYLLKARVYGSKGYYQKSMNELMQANTYANKNENSDQKYKTKYFIAVLKHNLGEYQEGLELLQSTVNYYENKFKEHKEYEYDYIKSLYATGTIYNAIKKYDSAYAINKKAINLSLKSKDSLLYTRLLLTTAMAHYYKKQYQPSLDSITKLKKLRDYKIQGPGTAERAELYLGKIYFSQNDFDKSISHLKKVDSIAFSTQYFFPKIREAYELLIKYYKEQNNTDQQILYIDKLLTVDSILDNNFKYLSRQINEEYSTPNLILEKQEIIDSLEKTNKTKIIVLIILSIVSLVLLIVLFLNEKKKRTYKKRFLELLNDNKKPSEKTIIVPTVTKKTESSKPTDIGISDIIVNDILKNLESFENNNEFLEANLTVSSLSKRFKTNSKYLSKVINMHKDKSFSNYVNELRIDYVVEELKSNSKFRRYTIKAIANEIGFNTTEAFSKSFYKTTGIYPSFFLKQLEKQQYNTENQENL